MVGAVNSAPTLIASHYEAARSSRVRAPLLIITISSKTLVRRLRKCDTRTHGKALSYYDSFHSRGFASAARSHEICKASSVSPFIGNSCFDTRPRSATAYGYNQVGDRLKGIKHFGNDYYRSKIGLLTVIALAAGQTFRKFK